MKIAVLTDVHANREAFEAVLADIESSGVTRIALLGDIVGYGADPEWCCDKVAELVAAGAISVQGNHDAAAATDCDKMTSLAHRAMAWTRERLSAGQRGFLAARPLSMAEGDLLFVHASAQDPGGWSYVTSATQAKPSFQATNARLILCGHVHVPLLVSYDVGGVVSEEFFQSGQPLPLLHTKRWLAVVGSVGQPRDGVPDAGWALIDTERNELTFRRTPYDVMTAAAKLLVAGLPEELAVRLMQGQ